VIRCEKCGGDLDTAMHCTRCGQLPVTYTSNVPAAPQWGAIEEILRLLDVYGSLGYEGVPQARAELAVLQAENARMREAIKEARRAVLRNPDSIAKSVYLRQEAVNILDAALSTPAPAGKFVSLERLREIDIALRHGHECAQENLQPTIDYIGSLLREEEA